MGQRAFVNGLFGKTEVEDFGVAALGDENISGLDVTVNDAFGVGGIQSVGDFDANGNQGVQFHRPA